ncbi:adenylate cyclase associated N terminal-domain-containing protein [Dipodascopsis uninucleata]
MVDLNNIPGINLVTLMKRLEAATSRLEDLTIFQEQVFNNGKSTTTSTPEISAPSSSSPTALVATSTPVPEASVVEEVAPSVKEFDVLIGDVVKPFVEISKSIDPLVEEQSKYLAAAFESEREFLRIVSKAKKPDTSSPSYFELFKPITEQVQKIQDIREKNRRSKFFNHLSTVSEGIPAIGWIGVEPTPVPFIGEMKDSAQFYSNRVLKEYKDVDKKHVEWANAFLNILVSLQAYVKKNHTTGPAWNPKGEELAKVLVESSANTKEVSVPAAGAPQPPPPPPPPPASVFEVISDSKPAGGNLGAVFAEINKGEAVTAGLKKVDKSQMTHKNPSLRTQEPVSVSRSKSPALPTKPQNLKQKKPSRIELEGTKWIVENFENNPEVIIEAEINHGVFIHRCKNSTIQIKGKFNTVTLNECVSTGLVVESLVSSVDIIKSPKFGLQVTGKLPTISIDQCDNGQIYLSKESLDVEIYTSKSTGLNVNIPSEEEDGDFKEQPVPEQLLHRIKGGKLASEIVEHMG